MSKLTGTKKIMSIVGDSEIIWTFCIKLLPIQSSKATVYKCGYHVSRGYLRFLVVDIKIITILS